MKFQIPKAQDPFGKPASRTFQINTLAEILRLCSLKMIKMLLKNEEVAKGFNQYFGHITDSLDLYEFPDVRVCEGLDEIDSIVYKFRNHPSIIKVKQRYKVKENVSFRLATTEEIKAIIRDLPTNKAAGGEIPVNVLKKSNFSFDELTV